MNQIKQVFMALTTRQKISIALVCVILTGGIVALARWQHENGFVPLFRGLSSEDAAAVVAKLREKGVEYRIAENDSVLLVPAESVAEMRLEMAGSGLVRSGRPGFELFDKVSFGVTDFAEQVNYKRALEGELERSIISISEIEKARVHLTFRKESVYLDSRQPAKASVLLKLRQRTELSAHHVQAITHLVASAVEGLAPESVSVLDMNGNLLGKPRRSLAEGGFDPGDATIEYQQAIEKQLLSKINATVEPLLGAGRFRAGVSVDCDMSTLDESEETFDPERSVMVASQKSEDASSQASGASGVPGTASALPRPSAQIRSGSTGNARRTESTTYQTSRKVSHRKTPQGAIKRISVSVLLDNDVRWEGEGKARNRVLIPPPPERVKVIQDLVAGAIGFSQDRGDKIVVEALPFDLTLRGEPPVDPAPPVKTEGSNFSSGLERFADKKQLIPLSAILAALFALTVGLWQYRKWMKARETTAKAQAQTQLTLEEARMSSSNLGSASSAGRFLPESGPLPVKRVSGLVVEKPEQCAIVLKRWLAGHEA